MTDPDMRDLAVIVVAAAFAASSPGIGSTAITTGGITSSTDLGSAAKKWVRKAAEFVSACEELIESEE